MRQARRVMGHLTPPPPVFKGHPEDVPSPPGRAWSRAGWCFLEALLTLTVLMTTVAIPPPAPPPPAGDALCAVRRSSSG